MTKPRTDIDMADLYVRNKLVGDDEVAFEVRMLQDPDLQDHVQTALAIQASLKLDHVHEDSFSKTPKSNQDKPGNSWLNLALAASVLLAVISSVMLARTSIESDRLKQQVTDLSQPQTSVLKVPVEIMRSPGPGTPDVVAQKPTDGSIIELDIELSKKTLTHPGLQFSLESELKDVIISWQAVPTNGRTSVLIRSEQIPAGLMQLYISDPDGNVLDRRLLEFK